MLLKEQALKRIKSQKKEHRRTKSLDDDGWTEGHGGAVKNDKISDKDKEKVREVDAPPQPAGTTATSEGGGHHSKKDPSPSRPLEASSSTIFTRPDTNRPYLNLSAWLDRGDKDRDKEKEHGAGGKTDKEGILASYTRLKQHYAAKLQQQQPPLPTEVGSHLDEQAETLASGEWGSATGEDAGFTYYYDLSPTAKMEGIVSKGLKTKFAPYFFEVHTGCILYDRIHFKGSIALRGGDHPVQVKHSQGPLPRVLFEQTEGHIFWIQYRDDDSTINASSGVSPMGSDRRDVTILSLAASSRDEMMDWVQVMRDKKNGKRKKRSKGKSRNSSEYSAAPGLESPEKSDKANGMEDSQLSEYDTQQSWKKEGWLWVKTSRPGDVWSSYYCLANEFHFEWFKRGVKQVISLENVSDIKTKVIPKGKLPDKARSTAFLTTKKQAATTVNSLHLQSLKDYCFKITLSVNAKIPYKEKFMGKFKFLVDSEERMNKWASSVRAQLGKAPRIGKKHFETPLGETKTFRSTVAMRAPKGTPTKIQTALTKIQNPPETGKAWLHNFLRDLAERGDAEMGKTPFGNYRVDAPMPKDGKYRIITFDGGGLRSVVSITILERLVEIFPDLLERVNLYCGTSGGAILATSLALGRSPTYIKNVMMAFGKYIFTRKARQFVTTARYDNNILRLMGEEMFGTLTLRDVPRSLIITAFQLDNGRVGEDFHSWIPRIMHNLPAAHPRPQSHFPKAKSRTTNADKATEKEARTTNDKDQPTRSLDRVASNVMSSSAIPVVSKGASPLSPTSFYSTLSTSGRSTTTVASTSPPPPSAITALLEDDVSNGAADPAHTGMLSSGSVEESSSSNNKDDEDSTPGFPVPTWPSEEDLSMTLTDLLMASSAAPTFFPTHKGFVDGGVFAHNPCMTAIASAISPEHANQQKLPQLEVLSLGTGRIAQYVEGDDLDWGIMQWARKLPDMIFGAAVWNAALLARMELGKNFHRLDPILEKPIPMDDPTLLNEIIAVGTQIDLDETVDWIKEHFYGMDTKKDTKKKKTKLKPRRRNGQSQWWGQSQIFGEMFSSDEEAINQRKRNQHELSERKRGPTGWLKSKLAKPLDADEDDSNDSEDNSPYDSANEDDVDGNDATDRNQEQATMGIHAFATNNVHAGEENIHAQSTDPAQASKPSIERRKERRFTSPDKPQPAMKHNLNIKRVGRSDRFIPRLSKAQEPDRPSTSSGIDEAEEAEEYDLKTEADETEAYDSNDSNDDIDLFKADNLDGGLHVQKQPLHLEEEGEHDTSDKESEAMPEDEFLAEIEQDINTLNEEIARLELIKREREQKLQAVIRRQERERKVQMRRAEKEALPDRVRKDVPEQMGSKLKQSAKEDRPERAVTERKSKGNQGRSAPTKRQTMNNLLRTHPSTTSVSAVESDDEDRVSSSNESDDGEEGKAKEYEREERAEKRQITSRRARGLSREGPTSHLNGDGVEDEEERGLVEVINSFLRREKKDKEARAKESTNPALVSPRAGRRSEPHSKRKEKEKSDVLSPGARRKIFQSFSTTSFSSISSHLPSFAFHSSSEKIDKNFDRIDKHHQQGGSAEAETERRKSPRSSVPPGFLEHTSSPPMPSSELAEASVPFDDEERERDREKKGHSNIATFINKRISEMREHRRKRSTTMPAIARREDADEDPPEEVAALQEVPSGAGDVDKP